MNALVEARPEQARPGQARSEQTRPAPARPGPARCRIAPTALALLESARQGLASAVDETAASGRYVAAHLAALRAAAAVVAARPAPGTGRRKAPRSVWELLPKVEPALAEWAAFFAAGAGKRAAAEAGLPRAVSSREADDLLRDAETFLSLVEEALGMPSQAALPLRSVG
ncbi:MAG TPA: SAV_6107 family HEPN domain-containing protein [Streptosporangiaceae bacterium]